MVEHPPTLMAPPPQSPNGAGNPTSRLAEPIVETKPSFDFRQFWHALTERIWIVALCVVAGLFVALGYLARTPKLYQGHIVLEVEFQEPAVIAGEESNARLRSMFLATQEALRTIEQNLTNRSLLARVVRAEGLADDGGRALIGRSVTSESAARQSTQKTQNPKDDLANIAGAPAFTPLEDGLAGALGDMIKPVVRRGTRLIDLFVLHNDPAMAQRLAEAIGREYIRNSIERRASFSQNTLRYLLEEEERLKANLQRSERAVADYKAKTPDALQLGGGAAATGSQTGAGSSGGRGGLVEDKLQDLNTKLTAAKSERLRLESELKQIESVKENVDALVAMPSISTAPMVNDRRRDLAQLEAVVATLAQRYKDKHPKMMAARAALSEAREGLRRAVLAQPAVVKNAIEQARATEHNLENAVHDQEKAALALNSAAIGYQELARQAETDRALYESVLRQIKETNLTKDAKTNAVSIIEHSPLPNRPVSPSTIKALALGLLGGLAVGLMFVFGADAIDRSVKTVDQAEATIGLPVFAAIPETGDEPSPVGLKKRKSSAVNRYRVMAETPEGPAAEAFRNLRAALSLLGPEAERKVTLFTSAVPDEGKSFTSANYALALAQQGHRVLLIDGDLRRPSMHKVFGLADAENNMDDVPGIVDALVGEIDLVSAARLISARHIDAISDRLAIGGALLTATGGQLFVLASGRRAPNPAEILSGTAFGQLVGEASRFFDRVVIDSAPILAVSDTLLMTKHVQTVCMVVRTRKTPRPAIRRAISLLMSSGIRPAGLVLNRMPRNRGVGYYYYYASPGYGKGEGSYSSTYGDGNGTHEELT